MLLGREVLFVIPCTIGVPLPPRTAVRRMHLPCLGRWALLRGVGLARCVQDLEPDTCCCRKSLAAHLLHACAMRLQGLEPGVAPPLLQRDGRPVMVLTVLLVLLPLCLQRHIRQVRTVARHAPLSCLRPALRLPVPSASPCGPGRGAPCLLWRLAAALTGCARLSTEVLAAMPRATGALLGAGVLDAP